MVKSSRQGAVRFDISQVNLLASQFSKSVGLSDVRHKSKTKTNDEQMSDWGSTSSTRLKPGPESDSVTSGTSGELQSDVVVSQPKYTALGFEVDLSGSQDSDTPYLRDEKVADLIFMTLGYRPRPMLGVRREILKIKEERFKRRRAQRLSSGLIVSRLLHSARQRLLTDLSLMVPGSIEQIKSLDPSGNGELLWSVLQSWLEGQPELKAQMNLTSRALSLIADYTGPSVEARSLQALKLYAVVVCKLDQDTYKEICRFLFPEDYRFSEERLR